MSHWIQYDEFVDLVRSRHHNSFSGLITGVSENQHSFQIGFDQGQIILLTYRIKKGAAALQLLTQMERAKVTEHPNTDIHEAAGQVPETSAILSQLTANTLEDTTTSTDISDVPESVAGSGSGGAQAIDPEMKKAIETAAIHHFGPIGQMVCDEHLSSSHGDLRAIMLRIAQDVGASEADTKAFFQSVSNS